MDVIVLSNIPHYRYLASALHEAGMLRRYVASISIRANGLVPSVLPAHWKRKLEGRRLSGLPDSKVRQIRLAEILQRGLPMTGLISGTRGSWINNYLFDWMALRWIEPCRIFTFINSVGLLSARKASRLGSTIVCDVRQTHPATERAILAEEGERLGLKSPYTAQLLEHKQITEFGLADYLVVPSEFAKQTFVTHGANPDKIFVVPYGVDLTQFRPVAKSPKFTVLFVGNLCLQKGVLYLLQAFQELKLPGAELLLIGSIDPRFTPLLRPYEGLFRHIPSVPKMNLYEYYGRSSVLVLPSLADSYGLVALEAMACATPLIVSSNTGMASLISQGVEGFVVPARDVETMKERLQWLFENFEATSEMGRAASRLAAHFSWEEYGRRSVSVYKQILTRMPQSVAWAKPA